MTIGPGDDSAHPSGDHPKWSESYYFNFIDHSARIGGLTRIAAKPSERALEGGFLLYLPNGRVGIQQQNAPAQDGAGELAVAGLRYERVEAMRTWRMGYDGPLLVVDDPRRLADIEQLFSSEPEFTDAAFDLTFAASGDPHDIEGSPLSRAFGGIGHYDQIGSYEGSIRVGPDTFAVRALGVRDHTWGVRDWSAPERWWFFSVNFGPDLAVVASRIVIGGEDLRGGFVWRDGRTVPLRSVEIDSTYEDDAATIAVAARLRLTDADGCDLEIAGEALTLVPVKMEGGATLITEALTRFFVDDRVGFGVSEYLLQLARRP
jgi:hypothetical protein